MFTFLLLGWLPLNRYVSVLVLFYFTLFYITCFVPFFFFPTYFFLFFSKIVPRSSSHIVPCVWALRELRTYVSLPSLPQPNPAQDPGPYFIPLRPSTHAIERVQQGYFLPPHSPALSGQGPSSRKPAPTMGLHP